MFSIAVISDEVSQDLDTVINFAQEFNIDGIEIRTIWDKSPQDLDDNEIARIRDKIGEANLKIFGIAAPFYKCSIDDNISCENHIEILKKSIKVAKRLNTSVIRVFAFWKQDPVEKYWDKILERYDEPVRIAEGEGVILGLENEASTMIGTGAQTRRFIDTLNTSSLKPLWDPCNELFADGGQVPYPNGYEHIRSDMCHMHFKDGIRNSALGDVCVPMCEGEINYRDQFKELINSNYSGCLSLETHWRIGEQQIEQALLDQPGGKKFSEAGEIASRVCMKNMLELLNELGVDRLSGIAKE